MEHKENETRQGATTENKAQNNDNNHGSNKSSGNGNGHKKLYRSSTNRVFSGVCAGLAEYFNLDVTVVRILWVLLVVFTGIFPGVLVYIISIFIIPERGAEVK